MSFPSDDCFDCFLLRFLLDLPGRTGPLSYVSGGYGAEVVAFQSPSRSPCATLIVPPPRPSWAFFFSYLLKTFPTVSFRPCIAPSRRTPSLRMTGRRTPGFVLAPRASLPLRRLVSMFLLQNVTPVSRHPFFWAAKPIYLSFFTSRLLLPLLSSDLGSTEI